MLRCCAIPSCVVQNSLIVFACEDCCAASSKDENTLQTIHFHRFYSLFIWLVLAINIKLISINI